MAEEPSKEHGDQPSDKAGGTDLEQVGVGVFAILLLLGTGVKVCGHPPPPPTAESSLGESAVPFEVAGTDHGGSTAPPVEAAPTAKEKVGLSAPIAAAYLKDDVVIAGLDVPSKAIRVQRIDPKGAVLSDRIALDDVKWSTDSDLKLAAGSDGKTDAIAVTWHGIRGGKLVRQLALLGPDLQAKGEPAEVSSAYCATKDGVWFANDATATGRGWNGEKTRVALPKDKDAALYCSVHRAWGVIEEEDKASLLPLAPSSSSSPSSREPIVMIKEGDFGEDDQRELSEYNVGDEMGLVRLAMSGAIAVRETVDGGVGALHKLKSAIGREDDVVAVDASSKVVVIVYTQDVSAACPTKDENASSASTRVQALRVDRTTFEESTVELSPGRCGNDVGPFFTGLQGDEVSIAWVERTAGLGKARAPIVGLSHAAVGLTGTPAAKRIEQVADALVDAGCDGKQCFAAALVRRDDGDAMTPGFVRVLRW